MIPIQLKKQLILFLYLALSTVVARTQTFENYLIKDYLINTDHPNNCSTGYVTGFPDDSTWVNFKNGDSITGNFALSWTDNPGTDLLLETSFHRDNYAVRLILANGSYSSFHQVEMNDWQQISNVDWKWSQQTCIRGSSINRNRFILPLDFITHFSISPDDTVTGIKVSFLETGGYADIAGVYIVADQPCNPINLGTDTTLCDGESLTLDVSTPNTAYLWHDNSTHPTFNVTHQGNYWVTATNNCRRSTDTIQVSYNIRPSILLGSDTTLCEGESLTLDVSTPNTTYLWHDNSTHPTFNVSHHGEYWVTATNNCGRSTDTIQVNYNITPSILLGRDTTLCEGEVLRLNATTQNATYLWNDNSSDTKLNIIQQGCYWVAVNNKCGETTDTIQVNYNSRPIIHLGNDTTLCQGESLLLDVTTPGVTYLWNDISTNPTLNIDQQGYYWVKASINNCSIEDTILINITDCEINLVLPTIFTPNSDGINDFFIPKISRGIVSMHTIIYNRWGNQVYETNKLLMEWNGQNTNNGTYFWIVNYTDINDVEITLKGHVTVLN
jgi:gliding motility-associated-like protein